MFWDLLEHLLLHEFDCDDAVFREVIALVDDSVVALAEGFGAIDVEVIADSLHALHLQLILNIQYRRISSKLLFVVVISER
jgi:hypothetical protein